MRIHEVLISMALGAILLAPIASTAQYSTGSPDLTQLRAQVADLQRKQEATNKRLTDALGLIYQLQTPNSPLVQEDARQQKLIEELQKKTTALSFGLGNLDARYTRHRHTGAIPGLPLGSEKIPNWICTGASCIPAGQINVVTWKAALPFPMTLQTSGPSDSMLAK